MILDVYIRRLFILTVILAASQLLLAGNSVKSALSDSYPENRQLELSGQSDPDDRLATLNSELIKSIRSGDTARSRSVVESILKAASEGSHDSITASDSYFYAGYYYLLKADYNKSVRFFDESVEIRKKLQSYDRIFVRALYNLSLAYFSLGDFRKMEHSALASLEKEKVLYGKSSEELFDCYSSLVAANIYMHEYRDAISYGDTALSLIGEGKQQDDNAVAVLYTNLGVSYDRLSDYSKAVLYLEKADLLYKSKSIVKDANYINLLNNLASTYFFLGQEKRSDFYFRKGLDLTETSYSGLSLNFLNSFAVMLGRAGQIKRGEDVLKRSLTRAKDFYGPDSRDYIIVLKNYAEYLRIFSMERKKSLEFYELCMAYLEKHPEDMAIRDQVFPGYAQVLSASGESLKALEIIQSLLFDASKPGEKVPLTDNPELSSIPQGLWSINVLNAKHTILWDNYRKTKDLNYLLSASGTSEMIVELIEKVRIEINEEESRIILGDRYRDSYLSAINDFKACFDLTGDKIYLTKAFEYFEKSKVASLLASTRELKATEFHIPSDLAGLEMNLKRDISYYNEKISQESLKKSPDSSLINGWKNYVLEKTRERDSLVRIFEKQYPEYYRIKYNTSVAKPEDIPLLAGRNVNYINYVVTDSVVYILLTNRKFIHLTTVRVDTAFFSRIREFRKLLSEPPLAGDARNGFERYQESGNYIYRTIFEPVKKYFISDQLLISPDNILSYIPFESIPTAVTPSSPILYNKLPYLMNDFRISYTYSATFLSELTGRDFSLSNKTVAFAPVYLEKINLDSLTLTRQSLGDLPFARLEAEYVSEITGGKLYVNDAATETAYKSVAGKYDIIHLAMHTALNDQYPMYSKMIFYRDNDKQNDGYLNTYEVYGIPLRAKMVVLSSCNTGAGQLHSGEGILSLARGFIYSGSKSVVVSMWEVEDRAGAEIVKSFYNYLRAGKSKSIALRKARLDYIENADMLGAHPYFWSSLVVYGNNTPLYFSRQILLRNSVILLFVIAALLYGYFRSR